LSDQIKTKCSRSLYVVVRPSVVCLSTVCQLSSVTFKFWTLCVLSHPLGA